MFAQTFVEGPARTNRGWTVVLSCCLQITIILLMVAVPLLRPDVLPRAVSTIVTIAPPPAPPPPPPPRPEVDRSQVRPRPAMVAGRLIAYSRIPAKVLITPYEPPDVAGIEAGVEGGVPGSPPSPTVSGVGRVVPAAAPPPVVTPAAPPKPQVERMYVGGRVQEALLISRVIPVYPPLAIQTRTSGVVHFTAVISREGVVTNLTLVSGHPLLIQAATNAVRQWRYKPTFLNGDPVEVVTTIDVHFILGR